jgi:GNAT superfamily N-acetyltransferase
MKITVSCPIKPSFRVAQVSGMFDVSAADKATQTFDIETPPMDDDWKIGLIVGPSGSGKSTVAQHLFGDRLYTGGDWSADQAVIDGFGDLPVKEVIQLLTAVGFSSPPSWLKPYHVLSNGEKFRCDLARGMSGPWSAAHGQNHLLTTVFDEYTSVVDRNVAKICSAAVSKGIKSGRIRCRFVGVTCHYDVMDWLEPDWVLDMATGTVSRRLLRRPKIELEIFRCRYDLWNLFKRHHYLSGSLAKCCRCYAALWNGTPTAFCAVIPQQGFKGWYRVSRIVTLPDFQGIGIGSRFMETLGSGYLRQGHRFSITASHPSVIEHCRRSAKWKTLNVIKFAKGRAMVSFELRLFD